MDGEIKLESEGHHIQPHQALDLVAWAPRALGSKIEGIAEINIGLVKLSPRQCDRDSPGAA